MYKRQISARPDADQADKAVVIADDSRIIQDQIRKTLERAGYRVVSHGDGQDAWEYMEKLRINGTVHDEVLAVISDIEMPRMDGHNLCKRIKANNGDDGIPVMLFSSLVNDLALHKGHAVGADDQISKPELGQLVTRLQDCLRRFAA